MGTGGAGAGLLTGWLAGCRLAGRRARCLGWAALGWAGWRAGWVAGGLAGPFAFIGFSLVFMDFHWFSIGFLLVFYWFSLVFIGFH